MAEPFAPKEEFRDLCLDRSAKYEEIYLCGLRNVEYNIILIDFSYLQFGCAAEDEVRYAYYPNPFLGASSELMIELEELREYVQEGIASADDYLLLAAELRQTSHPPLLRYENAPSQYDELVHPCSHMHFGHHAENRWPIRRILSPAAFGLLAIKHYYGERWARAGDGRLANEPHPFDEHLAHARAACSLVPDEMFSAREQRSFHLA